MHRFDYRFLCCMAPSVLRFLTPPEDASLAEANRVGPASSTSHFTDFTNFASDRFAIAVHFRLSPDIFPPIGFGFIFSLPNLPAKEFSTDSSACLNFRYPMLPSFYFPGLIFHVSVSDILILHTDTDFATSISGISTFRTSCVSSVTWTSKFLFHSWCLDSRNFASRNFIFYIFFIFKLSTPSFVYFTLLKVTFDDLQLKKRYSVKFILVTPLSEALLERSVDWKRANRDSEWRNCCSKILVGIDSSEFVTINIFHGNSFLLHSGGCATKFEGRNQLDELLTSSYWRELWKWSV